MPTSPAPRVLVTAAFDQRIAEDLAAEFDLTVVPPSGTGRRLADAGLDDELAAADAVVCELDVLDEPSLALAGNLGLAVSCRAAPVNVDLDACSRRGIPVATTPGRNADVTADLTFSLLLSALRNTSRAEAWLRTGAWTSDDVFEPYRAFRGLSLRGRTLGILGGGAVGRRVLARARAFGMRVLVYDPYLPADTFGDDAAIVPLDELLAGSDVVTVHVPLMESTIGLLGAEQLATMPRGAYLVNAGRAAVVEEQPLIDALRSGHLAGAGLDVYWAEPLPADHPLLSLPNVTLTPHIGGASDDVIVEHSRLAADALRAWRDGAPIPSVANAAALPARG
ncbi:NAD(P)-dependent oxidoreductase [Prauserella alba]|uniref:D-3-phosphoglycerate dehydrogenase SerA n=1 Tax=Prauserella alba TaxID=176898 RepID=A0ABN1VAI4_9PSEU|nr:NAD(P)-dependent oxidoreductase [Prauserella alba]MCP2179740.1 D-3-phosphoglycerate dehydrogenase [Prauserella alba]